MVTNHDTQKVKSLTVNIGLNCYQMHGEWGWGRRGGGGGVINQWVNHSPKCTGFVPVLENLESHGI